MSRQDKIREKRRLARLNKKSKDAERVEREVEDMLEDERALFADAEPEEPDAVRKDYGEEMVMMPNPAPTSFKELDDYRTMMERQEKIQEASYDVQSLVSNILHYRSDLSPAEKAEKIKKVGSEFGARVQNVISMDESQMEKSIDMDLLFVKALVAMDERHTPLTERFFDWIEKKKLTAAAENALSDDQFALVYTDKDGNKVRKYPIHDKSHIRSALSRAAQMMERGGEAATDARKALPKIREAAKKAGIGLEKSNSIIVEKGADERWRAVMFPSNNYIDWHGDILSEESHLEYVDWVNKNMDCSPVFQTWHTNGTNRESPVDFVGYENGFLIMSAPLTESEAAGLLRVQEKTDIGMSHRSVVLARDPDKSNVVTKYRMVEVTDLPLDAAANPFTAIELVTKEADMAYDTKKYLADILGSEEKAQKFLDKAGLSKQVLDEAKVPSKEKEVPEVAAETAQTPETLPQLDISQVVERVSKELGMEQLSEQFAVLMEKAEKVDVLEAVVKELSKAKEDELAEMIQPKASARLSWLDKRPSQSKETILSKSDEDEKLKKSEPEVGWLSQVTKTTPVTA